MTVHFVQHEAFEAPGAYLDWAISRGHQVTTTKVYENEVLPDTAGNIDFLIVMGGPQSPHTTVEKCPYFNAPAEMDLIRKCIHAGKFVIGVCLGAQLIGQALGANVEQSPEKEIGNFPIQLTEDGLKDAKLSKWGSPLVVGHWHNDMPGLTANAKVLATSEGCPRQIVGYSDKAYGFQCHMELTKEVVTALIENDASLEAESGYRKFVQSASSILDYEYSGMNEKLFLFLDDLVK